VGRIKFLAGLTLIGVTAGCVPDPDLQDDTRLSEDAAAFGLSMASVIDSSGADVAVYYASLAERGDSLLMGADIRMHAASTMKVPLLMQLYLDHEAGLRSLDSQLEVTTTFSSIVDGSSFELPVGSDSDTTFYARVGERVPVRAMIDRMITWSSNLATNMLIEVVDPARVTESLRSFGADSMEVLRGVEDLKAFEAGLSNTTTARDLGLVMRAVAVGDRFSPESRGEMLGILERQHFRENIPAGLPPGTRVANKTGWITGHNHDAAVVFPDGQAPYVLVILSRELDSAEQGTDLAVRLSRMVWSFHTSRAPAM
jgi:beta-lactamase class A